MDLDKYDKSIVLELIRDPRQSDNKISRATGISVKTVNRKRKMLEADGILQYMVRLVHGPDGIGDFSALVMYVVKFRLGIFRKQFLDAYSNIQKNANIYKHIDSAWLGEKDGHLALILMIESRKYSDILEIFNVELMSLITKSLGDQVVDEIMVLPLTTTLGLHHNYDMLFNMKNGKIDPKWPKDLVFITDK